MKVSTSEQVLANILRNNQMSEEGETIRNVEVAAVQYARSPGVRFYKA